LIRFGDGEIGIRRTRRIVRHLAGCESCRDRMREIRGEKERLAVGFPMPEEDGREGLAELLLSMAAWRGDAAGTGRSELRARLRWQIETYFGSPAVALVESPGMPVEELLGRAGELFNVFLGEAAAQVVWDEVLGGLE
jgi:hypothetical protein